MRCQLNHEEPEQDAINRATNKAGFEDISFLEGFKEKTKYVYNYNDEMYFNEATYVLAETNTRSMKLSEGQEGFKWVEYEQALDMLSHKSSRETLILVKEFLDEYLKGRKVSKY